MALNAATIAEIKRKAAAGIPLTSYTPEKQAIYNSYKSSSKSSSSKKSSSSGNYWDRNYGGKDNYIKNQQSRYKDADDDLRSRLEADAKRVGYSLPTSNKTSRSKSNKTSRSTSQNYAPQNVNEIISQLSSTMGQYSAPYEQMYRDLIANYPKFDVSSEKEMLEQAGTWAGLQIDPQVQALQRALEQAKQSAQSQEEKINANYTSFQDNVNRMLDQAGQRATESAIARGGGRSGAVEWLNNQYSTPIMEQAATQEAKKTADLNAISEALALAEQQASQQGQDLESRRGELEAARLAELQNLARAQAAGDWERIATATQNLMNMAAQSQQANNQLAANLLQYLVPTAGQTMDYNLSLTNASGEVPESLSSATTQSTTPVSLRNYAANQGGTIGYDPATKSVIINGKKYSTSDLQALGGQLVNNSWQIPQSALSGLF